MSCTHYEANSLFIEDVDLSVIAKEFGTPCYIYSQRAISQNIDAFNKAFSDIPHRLCYAVKSNSNIAILRLLSEYGAGFDIVSIGELHRVVAATGSAANVIFSGVGKTQQDIEEAIKLGIFCFNVESLPELHRITATAIDMGTGVNITLRLNPDIDANTHEHISTGLKENKFGIQLDDIPIIINEFNSHPSTRIIGIGSHIGSQITNLEPFIHNIEYLIQVKKLFDDAGISIDHINIGGGLGITYKDEQPPLAQEYANAIKEKLNDLDVSIIIEPGRAIVGNAGVLLTRVEYIKKANSKNFAIVDAGMNDLMRPALYNAWHEILPVDMQQGQSTCYDIVGPVCESADYLGKERNLIIQSGDLLAVTCAGAYGFSMSSNYNSRSRPAEVLVNGKHAKLIRRRETIDDALALEKIETE